MSNRQVRYAEEIKKVIAELIQRELKDPRIPELTSIVRTEVSKDLGVCKVYVSTLGSTNERNDAIAGLKSAAGYIKRKIGKKIKARVIPELVFLADDSIEYGIRMSKLIDETIHGEDKNGTGKDS